MLHTFRTLVGDGAFLDFLRDFYREHAIGEVTTAEWLRCVSERFGTRYETFWRQYLYEAAVPTLRVLPASGNRSIAYFAETLPGFSLSLKLGSGEVTVTDKPQTLDIGLAEWQALNTADYLFRYDLRGVEE